MLMSNLFEKSSLPVKFILPLVNTFHKFYVDNCIKKLDLINNVLIERNNDSIHKILRVMDNVFQNYASFHLHIESKCIKTLKSLNYFPPHMVHIANILRPKS